MTVKLGIHRQWGIFFFFFILQATASSSLSSVLLLELLLIRQNKMFFKKPTQFLNRIFVTIENISTAVALLKMFRRLLIIFTLI